SLRARAMSTLGGCMRIGAFIGPFGGAAVVTVVGTSGGYWVHLVAAVAAAVLVAAFREPGGDTLRTRSTQTDATPTWSVLRDSWPVYRTLGTAVLALGALRAARQVVLP